MMPNRTDVSSAPLPEVDEKLPVTSGHLWNLGVIPKHPGRTAVGTAIFEAQSEPSVDSSVKVRTEALPAAIHANWYAILVADVSVEIYNQVVRIARLEAGWAGPYSQALNSQSLRHFLRFWENVSEIAVDPELVMTTRGHLHAEWHKNRKRHLDIEFCDDGKVFYGLFDGTSIHEGIDRVGEVVAFLRGRRNNPLDWC